MTVTTVLRDGDVIQIGCPSGKTQKVVRHGTGLNMTLPTHMLLLLLGVSRCSCVVERNAITTKVITVFFCRHPTAFFAKKLQKYRISHTLATGGCYLIRLGSPFPEGQKSFTVNLQ